MYTKFPFLECSKRPYWFLEFSKDYISFRMFKRICKITSVELIL